MTASIPARVLQNSPVLGEDGASAGVPIHYGWPSDEQDAFEQGRGIVYLGTLGIVKVSGPDRLSWLTTLSSQIVSDLKPGDSKELLLLDPQGRITFAAGIVDDSNSAFLITEKQFAEPLAQFLESMKFMLRVEIAVVSDSYVAFATDNEIVEQANKHRDVVQSLGGFAWSDPWPGVCEGGAAYFQGQHPEANFLLYLVPTKRSDDFLDAVMEDSSFSLVGIFAANATRIASWRPLPGFEVDDKTVPAELDWIRSAVHLNKGCYCGQESVARIINLGKPPRRLTFIQLDGSSEMLPPVGTPVEHNGRQVGVLTSVARHFEMGPIGLAILKRNLDPAAPLSIGGVDALQEVIVPVDGRSDHAPDTRPGAGLKRLDPGKRDIRTRGPGTQH